MENEVRQARKRRDLTGMRFGRLTVTGASREPYKSGETRWICACDCGGETHAKGYDLLNGAKRSCGCLKSEHLADMRRAWARMRAEGQKGGRHRHDPVEEPDPTPVTDEAKARFTDWWMFGDHEGRQEAWFRRFVPG